MSSVVVTGAGGFLGRPLLAALMRRGCQVHALGRGAVPQGISKQVIWHPVDLLDRGATRNVLGGIRAEGLVHLAWETAHGGYWHSSANLDWVASSLQMLRDFREYGGRRVVIAGSSAEYDWTGTLALDEERTPLRPASPYGHSKNALREILGAWAPQAGLSWTWGRLFNIYGPYEKPERLVPRVIRTLQGGRKLAFDDGAKIRDFLHVDDAADAFAALYTSHFGGAVNIGSGEPLAIKSFIKEIAECIGRPDLVEFGALPASANEPVSLVASVGRLREEIGWSPQSRQERLRETCEWWQSMAQRTADRN